MTEAAQTPVKDAPKDEKPPEYPKCEKCGEVLDASPYGVTKQAVVEMASDHASKRGCDWAAKNLDKVWQLSEKPLKEHEAKVKADSEKAEKEIKEANEKKLVEEKKAEASAKAAQKKAAEEKAALEKSAEEKAAKEVEAAKSASAKSSSGQSAASSEKK